MSDLNSVFLVGRVTRLAERGKGIEFTVTNTHYYFDEEKKEYKEDSSKIVIHSDKKFKKLKIGDRVGINGRMTDIGVSAHSVQILDESKFDKTANK